MQRAISSHPLLEPWRPTSDDPFNAIAAAHLLNRAGFGATRAEISTAVTKGLTRTVDELLDFPDSPAEEQSQSDVPDLSSVSTDYPRTFADRQRLFQGLSREERQELNNKLMRSNRGALDAIIAWWLRRMVAGPHPLQEKLVLFWHGHFTTSSRDERASWLMWQQQETLRQHSAGNFRDFVHEIARDPAMIAYLNNQENRKGRPNENFARELMELFTLGIGNYSEADIKEAARAFTGWGHDGERFILRRSQHDADEKTFFGLVGRFGGEDIIDIILKRDVAARYIASKLFAYFVYEPRDPALVAALGRTLTDANYELRPLLRTILLSRALHDSRTRFNQIKGPIQLVIGTVRKMEISPPDRGQAMGWLRQMGQVPLDPPNVKGWPGGRSWINSSTLFVRYNVGIELAKRIKKSDLVPGDARSPRALVQHWADRLLQRRLDETKFRRLELACGDAASVSPDAARKVVELIVSMPEFQLC